MDFTAKRTHRRDASAPPTPAIDVAAPAAAPAAPESFAVDLKQDDHGRNERAWAPERRWQIAVRLALLVHLGIGLGLVLHGGWEVADVPLMLAVAVPFAQASLVALWAGLRPMRSFAKFSVAAVGAAWGWFLAISVLPGIALRSAVSASWAAGLGVQAALVLGAVSTWRVRASRRAAAGDGKAGGRRLQYDVVSLLAWTTIAAVLLGLSKTASELFGWSGATGHTYFRFLPILGAFNAIYALCVMLSLASRRRVAARLLAAGAVIAALAWVEPRALQLVAGSTGGLASGQALLLAAAQAALLYATLVPLRAFRP